MCPCGLPCLGDGFGLPVMGPKPQEAGGQIAGAATVPGDGDEVHLNVSFAGCFCCCPIAEKNHRKTPLPGIIMSIDR